MSRSLVLLAALLAGCASDPPLDTADLPYEPSRPMLNPQGIPISATAEPFVCDAIGRLVTEVQWPLQSEGLVIPLGMDDPLQTARKRLTKSILRLDTDDVPGGIARLRGVHKKLEQATLLGWPDEALYTDRITEIALELTNWLIHWAENGAPSVDPVALANAKALRDQGVDKLDQGQVRPALTRWRNAVLELSPYLQLETPTCTIPPEIASAGPWADDPTDPSATWHPDAGVTLVSDPTLPVPLFLPTPSKPDPFNLVSDMATIDGKLYPRYGNDDGDALGEEAPYDLLRYDMASDTVDTLFADAPDETVGIAAGSVANGLVFAGGDPGQHGEFGNVYTGHGSHWHHRRTVTVSAHVWDIAAMDGRIYAAYQPDDGWLASVPRHVLVSDDDGRTFEVDEVSPEVLYSPGANHIATVSHGTGDYTYIVSGSWPNSEVWRTDGTGWEAVDFESLLPAGFTWFSLELHVVGDVLLLSGQSDTDPYAHYPFVFATDGASMWEIPVDDTFMWEFGWGASDDAFYMVAWDADTSWNFGDFVLYESTDLLSFGPPQPVAIDPNQHLIPTVHGHHGRVLFGPQEGRFNQIASLQHGVWAAAYAAAGEHHETFLMSHKGALAGATLEWDAATPGGSSVRFQVRSANNRSKLDTKPFRGPDGTPGSWYTVSGEALSVKHANHRLIEVKAQLASTDPAFGPTLRRVSVVPAVVGAESGLGISTYGTVATAGQPLQVEANWWSGVSAAPVRFDGRAQLAAYSVATGLPVPVWPESLQLEDGVAVDPFVTVYDATETVLELTIGDHVATSNPFTVSAGDVEHFDIQTNLTGAEVNWSGAGPAGSPFELDLQAVDRWGNPVDHSATIDCVATRLTTGETAVAGLPMSGGTAFTAGAVITTPGEWSVVCTDEGGINGQVTVDMQ